MLALANVGMIQFINSSFTRPQRLKRAWLFVVMGIMVMSHLQHTKPQVYQQLSQALMEWHNAQRALGYQATVKECFLL